MSNEYAPLNKAHINLEKVRAEDYLDVTASEVLETLVSLNANKSVPKNDVPKNDVPTKILKRFAAHLSSPIAELINACIREGCWPDFLKIESVTPVPKVPHPKSANDLRKIAGLPNLSKIMEKIIVKYMVEDMRSKLDDCQFANQANQSINHYLIYIYNWAGDSVSAHTLSF